MKIEAQEYLARVTALRAKMAEMDVDLVVGFSNLLEIAIVRYYCGFAPTNESSAIVIPAEGEVIVCSGQASYDDCQLKNELPNSRIAILPEIGEVSGFVYDTEGQLDFEELFKQVKAEHPNVKKVGFIGRLIFPAIIMDKLRKVFSDAEVVDMDELLAFMARRAPGNDAYSTKRREPDVPVFISGIDGNVTNGDTIEAVIYNQNQHSSDYSSLADTPRPSHADFAAIMKYGKDVDLRGGGHFSGRLTAPMCIAGGICLQILKEHGIYVGAHIYSIGDVCDTPFDSVSISKGELDSLKTRRFTVINEAQGEKMKEAILSAAAEGDSVGGVLETAVVGMPAGVGEPWFDSLESMLSHIMFSIPAVKGIEFGAGFAISDMRGSEANDPMRMQKGRVAFETNNNGGINGGISNGMPIIFRTAVKPTSTIFKAQNTIDFKAMTDAVIEPKGRHDPAIVHRARVVQDAVSAIVLCDALAMRFGTDFLK